MRPSWCGRHDDEIPMKKECKNGSKDIDRGGQKMQMQVSCIGQVSSLFHQDQMDACVSKGKQVRGGCRWAANVEDVWRSGPFEGHGRSLDGAPGLASCSASPNIEKRNRHVVLPSSTTPRLESKKDLARDWV